MQPILLCTSAPKECIRGHPQLVSVNGVKGCAAFGLCAYDACQHLLHGGYAIALNDKGRAADEALRQKKAVAQARAHNGHCMHGVADRLQVRNRRGCVGGAHKGEQRDVVLHSQRAQHIIGARLGARVQRPGQHLGKKED